MLTLGVSETSKVQVFLPKRYSEVMTDTDMDSINSKAVSLHLVYQRVCESTVVTGEVQSVLKMGAGVAPQFLGPGGLSPKVKNKMASKNKIAAKIKTRWRRWPKVKNKMAAMGQIQKQDGGDGPKTRWRQVYNIKKDGYKMAGDANIKKDGGRWRQVYIKQDRYKMAGDLNIKKDGVRWRQVYNIKKDGYKMAGDVNNVKKYGGRCV